MPGERRLGRGLDFLLSDTPPQPVETPQPAASTEKKAPPAETATPAAAKKAPETVKQSGGIEQLAVSSLVANPDQPRRDFKDEEIQELGASIRASGMLQPVLVRKMGKEYQIIAGERRWRAARSIGLERIPVIVREVSETQVAVFALVENLHRSDLNAVEKARAFRRIQEMTKASTEEVARQVGLNRTTVTNFLRLLELAPEVLAHVSRGTLSMGHARALLGVTDSKTQRELADEIIRQAMSVRAVEALVNGLKDGVNPPKLDQDGKPAKRVPAKAAWIKECEDDLSTVLGAAATVRYGKKKSKITIECGGREDFERVLKMLRGEG